MVKSTFAHEILFGTLKGVEQFILAGADIEETDEYGFSPLIEATIANKNDVVALLLEYGAAIDNADTTGRTALHWAVDNHNLALCELLLANKADANAYTTAGQAVLVYPLLRQQIELKKLLYRYGAKLSFAQDFIQAKLLGHRYELIGQVDLVNAAGRFIEINYEGFFLEFTLDVILNSLRRYQNNFSSRHLRSYFENLQKLIAAFANAQALLKYQRYTLNIKDHTHSIDALLDQELLLLPVAYEGHAIALIKYKNWLIRCDRGENSRREGSIVIYECQRPYAWDKEFCKRLIYSRQSREFLTQGIHRYLGLVSIANLPIQGQIIGNCSWANIEASILAMLFVLSAVNSKGQLVSRSEKYLQQASLFFQDWQTWDKDRALEECIQGFYYSNKARGATKATILAAIFFQKSTHNLNDLKQAEAILKILTLAEYNYLLKSYLKVYWQLNKTAQGKDFLNLLDACGVSRELA
ncbi:Dot/Icm T4SS effector AnkH/LegA3 [Rickettsiella endosymbiont of Xylota segnis]|uniref:Dot/Icm T4SS effector AnkH/LegA3 n=1 Tax=Rickettsiella endosymbiont of Xylota segnis TaxID=3066238 RepID=UPI0030D43983